MCSCLPDLFNRTVYASISTIPLPLFQPWPRCVAASPGKGSVVRYFLMSPVISDGKIYLSFLAYKKPNPVENALFT